MEVIPQLIKTYSFVLYAICGIACTYFLLSGITSMRELRRAVFRLERRAVVTRAINAMLKAVLCIIIGAAIYAVTTLAPVTKVNALLGAATSTPQGIMIPTSMPTAAIQAGQAQGRAAFTATITFTDPSQPITITGAAESDCSNANAQIISPAQGEKVSGNVTVKGTAVLAVGDWYKLEIQKSSVATWTLVGRGEVTVISNVLLQDFSTAAIAAGIYPFRLQIIGADGAVRATCRMPISIGK